jgi:hypothetical protein
MRVAGGSAIRRYLNEELVWVEPQNMPQALYLQLLGFLIYLCCIWWPATFIISLRAAAMAEYAWTSIPGPATFTISLRAAIKRENNLTFQNE